MGVVEIATPCHARWEQMAGDAQVRHCAACKLNVYNLSELTADDARGLIRKTEGRLCVRFFVRPDGRLLTRDCPQGIAARLWRRIAGAAAALSALAVMLFADRAPRVEPAIEAGPAISAGPRFRKDVPIVDPGWADRRRQTMTLERQTDGVRQGRPMTLTGVIRGQSPQ